MGIHLAGFRDEQAASIQTKELRTDDIVPSRIERGLVPGWRELEEYRNCEILTREEPGAKGLMIDGVPLKAMMVLEYSDYLPETVDQLATENASSREELDEHA